jgi:hypothetical protein
MLQAHDQHPEQEGVLRVVVSMNRHDILKNEAVFGKRFIQAKLSIVSQLFGGLKP